jgi:hypothetical protein
MTTISKTTFTFTVLHRTDEPFTWDESDGDGPLDNNLGEALSRSWDGHAVGWVTSEETVGVPDIEVPEALVELSNDGSFFDEDLGIDVDGEDTLIIMDRPTGSRGCPDCGAPANSWHAGICEVGR